METTDSHFKHAAHENGGTNNNFAGFPILDEETSTLALAIVPWFPCWPVRRETTAQEFPHFGSRIQTHNPGNYFQNP